ncbi:hypothetical protein ABZ319_34635 [Nocardia sp. NPDC005978]|uniref:hypothetical protein n=1 Tax=Nocardia sp. NPDC005978 TaxID=3156725 RepID=UPI0033A0418E
MSLKNAWLRPAHDEMFENGAVLLGQIEPLAEFSSDRNAPKRQRLDLDDEGRGTGKLLWKGTVADPTGMGAKNSTFDVVFVADVMPVPSAQPVLPGVTPVRLEGLQVKPKIVGNGEYKSIGWNVRATGFEGDTSGSKQPPADVPASRPARDGKAVA